MFIILRTDYVNYAVIVACTRSCSLTSSSMSISILSKNQFLDQRSLHTILKAFEHEDISSEKIYKTEQSCDILSFF
jgi:hypothetical protein